MKKSYRLTVDCANCAAKIERAVGKLDGVVEASVNFMAQKLNLETEDNRLEEVLEAAKKVIAKIEPGAVFRA